MQKMLHILENNEEKGISLLEIMFACHMKVGFEKR